MILAREAVPVAVHRDSVGLRAPALPKPASNWSAEIADNRQEIRPTIGELMTAAEGASPTFERDVKTGERVSLGSLKSLGGRLVEWAVTKRAAKSGQVIV